MGVVVPELAAEDYAEEVGNTARREIPARLRTRCGRSWRLGRLADSKAARGLLDAGSSVVPTNTSEQIRRRRRCGVAGGRGRPANGKKPKPLDVATGGAAEAGASDDGFLVVGGESGAAIMLGADASGEEARGRVAFSRERGPAPGRRPDGTDRPPVELDAGACDGAVANRFDSPLGSFEL